MSAFTFPAWLRAVAVGLLLGLWPAGAALAATNVLTMTERPGGLLDVDLSLLGVTQVATLVDPLEAWGIGPGNDGLPRRISGTLLDNSVGYNEVAWLEPGDSLNDLAHARFNVFFLHGSADGSQVMTAFSEVDYASVAGYYGSCETNGQPSPCPILQDGQSFTLPISYYDQNVQKVQGDPMTVTFTDRGDVATGVPEPAAWALMLLGFGGLGAMLRRWRVALT